MNRLPQCPHWRAGYSLIELIVILVIFGVMTAIAVPKMGGLVRENKLDAAAGQLSTDLAYARMLAIRAGDRMVVHFTSADQYVIRTDEATPRTLKTVRIGQEYPGVTVVSPTTDQTLVFNSRGVVRNVGTGVIEVRSEERTEHVRITASGRVYRGY